MAATAQDSMVPLRGGDGKLKDEDMDDGALASLSSPQCTQAKVVRLWSSAFKWI